MDSKKKPMSNKNWLRKCRRDFLKGNKLHANIKANLPEFKMLLERIMHKEGAYEGRIYRFYHYSFKVYYLNDVTEEILKLLRKINPNRPKVFCKLFQQIMDDAKAVGEFKMEHNRDWQKHTRPIVEAFFHAKYMLEMVVSCGEEYDEPPGTSIHQKWGSLLELYKLR